MHQYTASTCFTLGGFYTDTLRHTWQILVPQEAFRHPFLLHSLLSITALHKLFLGEADNPTMCLQSALHHRQLALTSSKSAMSNPTNANQDALYTFSALTNHIAWALPFAAGSGKLQDPIAEIAQIMALTRGSTFFAQENFEGRREKIAPPVRKGFLSSTAAIPEDIQAQLDILSEESHILGEAESSGALCLKAIEVLALCFRNTVDNEEEPAVVLCWLAMIPRDFAVLLVERQDLALVILAHYAVLLYGLRDVWWCKGWGVELVGFISRSLEGRWLELVEWPRRKVGLSFD